MISRFRLAMVVTVLCASISSCGGNDNGPTGPAQTMQEPAPPPVSPPPVVSTPACVVGMTLDTGESCAFDSVVFEVRDDGFGCVGSICAGRSINLNSFRASKISGSSRWRIDELP